ncbi:MAG TPA: hypothetical protein VMM60_12090 [Ilumatobacter sp.]|nr:hypothetical protein [Ilumatobacter sp.]
MNATSEVNHGAPLEVLILSFDSSTVIERCLASLTTLIPDTPVAIREHSDAVGAVDRLHRLAAGHSAPVRISTDPTNPGFGAGCNALAASSTATHLLFLNPDTELVSWPFHTGLPPLGRLVGPLMVDSGDPSRHYGVRYRIRDEMARSWLRLRGQRPNGAGFVSGAALLIARADFERIDGFDEGYFLFYEDIDLCLRANAAGIGTYVDDRFTVRHTGAHSTSSRFGTSLQWSYQSAVRFHRQQGSPIIGYRCYVVVDSIARATLHLARGRRTLAAAYLRLAQRSAGDLLHRTAT